MSLEWSRLNRQHTMRTRWPVVVGGLGLFSPLPLVAVLTQMTNDVESCFTGSRNGYCDVPTMGALVGSLLALLILPVGLLLLRRMTPFIRVLRDTPHRVVWLYVEGTTWQTSLYGVRVGHDKRSSAIVAGLDDGRTLGLQVQSPEALFDALAARTPRATLGYTEDLHRAFALDPRSLSRA